MHATIGDKLVIESTQGGSARRLGVITGLRHPDGSPPYVVHWLDAEHETLVFPGPDARIIPKDDHKS
ncbi:DUF1918 domain-containing protein [Streptosporangiaceae bacterium NEAU-GS5]|nr:DUF1918 domain-containing protein [Streptosporangiaceae bacterium NEAU-GS5]